jgi:UDP:flavonoid glycosyltransferase YjiC (YdhE family)
LRALFNVAGGFGHLFPLVPLARALSARGADVAVAVPEYFQGAVEDLGLTAIPLTAAEVSAPTGEFKAGQFERAPFERGRSAIGRYLGQSVAQTPAMRAAAVDWGADVLVRDTTAFAAWLAGEQLNLPVAVLDHSGTPNRLLAATIGDLLEQSRDAVGLPPDPRLTSLNKWLHLLAAPVDWYPAVAFGPTTHLFQPPQDVVTDDPTDMLAELDPSRPFIYATLGTIYNDTPGVFETILEVLAEEPVQVLATIGPDADPASFGPLPPHIRIERFVPQAAVLPHANAVICHCGYGSLMSPLRYAIPLVVIPLASGDSAAVAARVERFGVGVVVPEGAWTVDAVRTAVRAVLDEPAYGAAAGRAAASIAALPPFDEAARLVEQLARAREPVRNPGFGR